jgi:hypothetical protein
LFKITKFLPSNDEVAFHNTDCRRFTYLLLYVTLLIGPVLDGRSIPSRTFLTIDGSFDGIESAWLEETDALQLIEQSRLIDDGFKPLLRSSLTYFYEHHEYGLSIVLLLPVYEHVLRKLFVTANQCPDRLLTAEVSSSINHCIDKDFILGHESVHHIRGSNEADAHES